MTENLNLKGEEKVVLQLRSLYSSYGYSTYKMSRFEEYDLYAGNKDFLVSNNIITFTDTDGTLMALKPDVTLSIVKSFRPSKASVSRVCYDENVYRVSDKSGTFREILQTGIECLGDVSEVELCEVVKLAQLSLKKISQDSILTISHMGIVEKFASKISSDNLKKQALESLASRNFSSLEALAKANEDDSEVLNKLAKLSMLMGPADEIYNQLRAMDADEQALKELERVVSVLDEKSLRIDFSVLGEMNYYNGITFRGYVRDVPGSVLSGGQYDKLMKRLGKKAKAVGFAVYMDSLERVLTNSSEYDVDVALIYSDKQSLKTVLETADSLRANGKSVITLKEVPFSLRYRELMVLEGGNQDA